MKKKCVFTLLELIIVIAVIGLLCSLLFPSLREARTKAKLSSCVSNLKQIGVASYGYISDNSGSFPVGLYDKDGDDIYVVDVDTEEGYETGLAAYINYSVKVFECAGFELANFAGGFDPGYIEDPSGNRHYAYRTYRPNNFRYYNYPNDGDSQERWKKGLIKWNYSLKLGQVASDTIHNGDYVRSQSYRFLGKGHYFDRRGVSFGNHENKYSNLLYVDGSARIFRMSDYLTNENLTFQSTSVFSIENNSNNLGLFDANMSPDGTSWTVIED